MNFSSTTLVPEPPGSSETSAPAASGIPALRLSSYSAAELAVTAALVTLLMAVIVIGNMLVIIAVTTEKELRGVQNWYIASLAVADFLVGLIIMPFSLAQELLGYWAFGTLWCRLHAATDVLACTSSINHICLISVERYWAVTRPVRHLRRSSRRRTGLSIAAVWLFSALVCVPPLLGWRTQPDRARPPTCQLSSDIGYVLFSALGSFYIPSIIMIFVYIRIYMAARSRTRRNAHRMPKAVDVTPPLAPPTSDICGSSSSAGGMAAPQSLRDDYCTYDSDEYSAVAMNMNDAIRQPLPQTTLGGLNPSTLSISPVPETPEIYQSVSSRSHQSCISTESGTTLTDAARERRRLVRHREKRATLVLGLILGSFIACWLPFFTMYVLAPVCGERCRPPAWTAALAFWLGYVNSALNPAIYTVFNEDFRRAFRRILCK